MNSRRAFLRLLGGSGAMAASGVSVRQAAEAVGVPIVGEVGETDPYSVAVGGGAGSNINRLLKASWRKEEARNRVSAGHIPPHIQTKKSWSPVFKEHVYMRETAILEAFRDKLDSDEVFARKVAQAVGLK